MAGRLNKCLGILRILNVWRNFFIVFLVPVLFLPISLSDSKVSRCAYGVIVIAIFWVFEALPLPVTSLLPVLLFPLLGVITVKEICASYFKDTLMLFLGSLIVAVAVERWNLHRRIALRALTLVGTDPRWLMIGIMLPCWFLSMWMSNTATTAMMVPILNAILTVIKDSMNINDGESTELLELEQNGSNKQKDTVKLMEHPNTVVTEKVKPGNGVIANEPLETIITESTTGSETDGTQRIRQEIEEKRYGSSGSVFMNMELGITRTTKENEAIARDYEKLAKTFALCTAFAANTGGMATLTGTPPNIILKGQAEILFNKYHIDSGITFANWLVIGLPLSLMSLVFIWLWLQVFYAGIKCFSCFKKDSSIYNNVKGHLKLEYSALGPITFAEAVVLFDFIILALLWITRKPEFVPGWGSAFAKGYSGDSVAAVLMGVLLFALPSRLPEGVMFWRRREDADESMVNNEYIPLLDWKTVNSKMAWGVIILMGGGFALADACEKSGLSMWISGQLADILRGMPMWITALILSSIVGAATNITSNAATATLFLPIVGSLAISLGIHPLYFMIPVGISCSFAFLLPVGTPPNAIVFSTGYLTVKDMVIAGSVVNVVTVLFLIIALQLWIAPFYNLYEIPEAFFKNTTLANATHMVTSLNSSLVQ